MPSGYIYSWTGKVSSAYGTAGNWYNNTVGATATTVPGVNDEALIATSGNLTGPGAAFELGLTGTGAGLSVGGTLYGAYAYVGGTVTLASGSALGSGNLIDIGDNSSSTIAGKVPTVLTVGSGSYIHATLATANTFDILVGQGGGTGTLAVTGSGIASSGTEGFWVGNGGTGVISVSGGGVVTGGTAQGSATRQIDLGLGSNGGNGALYVSGTNSLADFTNTVEVGFGGTGLISVTGGGIFYAGEGLDSLNIGDVYNGAIGGGTVNVNASTAYLAGIVEVGVYGQGSLDVSNGGFVDAYFYLPGTAPVWSALIGANAGSNGTLSLSTGSTMVAAAGLAVGSGGVGELDVSSSTLSVYAAPSATSLALDAGVASGATGVVNVTGGLINDVGLAGMVIGGAGTGSLSIGSSATQGGTVLTGNTVSGVGMTVAESAGSRGSIAISGVGSGLGVSGELADGSGGTGAISLSGGARLVDGLSGTQTGMILGGSGGTGSLSIVGSSQAVITGQTDAGEYGFGTISLTGGGGFVGQASGVPVLLMGASAGSTGSVLISDTYSYASLTGGISVGSSGSGTLTVQNHALVVDNGAATPSVSSLIVGVGAGSNGTVTLASQAEMNVLGAGVAIGSDGSGMLSVDSATLTIRATAAAGVSALNIGVTAGSSGTVDVAGGVINDAQSAGAIVGDGGTGSLVISQVGTQGGVVLTGDPSGTAGLAVGVGAGSSGSVSVSGSASGLAVYGTAQIGISGQGNLTLQNGGRFIANLGPANTGLVLGGSGGTGTMSIAGSGAEADVIGQSIIGNLGAGALTVTGGSSFTGTASGVPAMVIGAASTGTGSVLISGASSFVPLAGGLVVGSSGTGSIGMQNSGVLAVYGSTAPGLPGIYVGQNTTSSGTISISSGAEMLAGTGIALGSFGSGLLTVSNATLIINTSSSSGVSALDAGVSVGSHGSLNVAGGVVDDLGSAGMVIGDIGAGSVSITQIGSQGGTLLTGSASSGTGLFVGRTANGTGSVSVSGSASALAVSGSTVVGASGVGSLTLGGEARYRTGVSATGTGLVLGGNTSGIGSMVMSAATQASVLGQTDIGQSGSGFLSVTGGSGLVVQASGAPAIVVAGVSGSTGSVLVSDVGSYISISGGLEVGGSGYGTFTVTNHALVVSSAALSVGSHGNVVTSAGGSLSASTATNLGTITASGGTLSFLGAVTGGGTLAIGSAGAVSLGSTETNAVAFASGGGGLIALSAADIGGTVSGWSAGDFIDLSTVTATSESFSNGTLSLLGAGNQVVGTIGFSGALATHNFTLTTLAGAGTAIGYHS